MMQPQGADRNRIIKIDLILKKAIIDAVTIYIYDVKINETKQRNNDKK